jgi:hypothetical protein
MNQAEHIRRFLLNFFQKISGKEKSEALLRTFIDDPALVEKFVAIEFLLPRFEIQIDEMTIESSRATLQGSIRGRAGSLAPPKTFDIPFALGCRLVQGKIVDHWLIADQLGFVGAILFRWSVFQPG